MTSRLTTRRWLLALALYAVPFVVCAVMLPYAGKIEAATPEGREYVLHALRIPRVWLALLAGGALAMTGAAFQVILRNPLAEPFTLGEEQCCISLGTKWRNMLATLLTLSSIVLSKSSLGTSHGGMPSCSWEASRQIS